MPAESRSKKSSPKASKSSAAARRAAEEAAAYDPIPLAPKLLWLAGFAAWLFAAASLISFDPADPPTHLIWPANDPPANWCGPVGAMLAYHALKLLGWAAWLPVACLGSALVLPLFGRKVDQLPLRAVGVTILAAGIAAMVALHAKIAGPMPALAGGTIGRVAADELALRFSTLGATLWLVLGLAVGAVVAFERLALAVPVLLFHMLTDGAHRAAKTTATATATAATSASTKAGAGLGKARGSFYLGLSNFFRARAGVGVREHDLDERPEVSDDDLRAQRAKRRGIATIDEAALDEAAVADEDEDVEWEYVDVDEDEEYEEEDDAPGAPQVFTEDQIKEKIAALPVRFAQANKSVAQDEDLRDLQNVEDMEGYRFPTLDLLEPPEENFSAKLEGVVRSQAEALEAALRQYKVDGEVVGIESGPVITLYDVRLAPGTKVAQIQSVQADIARALKAVNIRIVPNQVGRDTIAVEVPNPTKERVRLRELMSNRENFEKMKLPMFLGKDASGDPLIGDLPEMPHMLIAGTTGSGKSVCMNTIIMSFLYTRKPNELKMVLVDPKMVEMSQFKDIPHLMCPVVTEMAKAAAILEWACKKMDERYELLAEAGCRDIASYNALSWEELKERIEPASVEEEKRIPRKLPYMVFIIDELADLMMTAKEVEGSIIRIAQKARAVGIHLILATQRPQANVVTGLIKSNMPCRVTFKVASAMDSRIVLDQKGGELLLGQGDMLFLSPRSSKLTRSQGTLVDDSEIRKVARFMRDVATPTFERQLVSLRTTADEERLFQTENHSSASLAAAQEDPLFDRAVEIVAETQRGSVSLLQRRLGIGYTRSSRLIDLMGMAGLIGAHKGSVAREVLVTPEQWEQVKHFAEQAHGAQFPTAANAEEADQARAAIEGKLFVEGSDEDGEDATPPWSNSQDDGEPQSSASTDATIAESDTDDVPIDEVDPAVEALGADEDDAVAEAAVADEAEVEDVDDEVEDELEDAAEDEAEVDDETEDDVDEDGEEWEYEDAEEEASDDDEDEGDEEEEDEDAEAEDSVELEEEVDAEEDEDADEEAEEDDDDVEYEYVEVEVEVDEDGNEYEVVAEDDEEDDDEEDEDDEEETA